MKYKLGLKPVHVQPTVKLCSYYTPDLPSVDSLKFPLGHPNTIQPEMFMNDQLGDCIAPDTKVLTADLHWVAAGSLRVGDELLGFDENHRGGNASRGFKNCTVERAGIVMRPCYRLTFEDGTEVVSSSGHQWLVSSRIQGQLGCLRWQRTEDMLVGPIKQTKVIKPLSVWEENHSWAAGYVAAALDGEGNLCHHQYDGVRATTGVMFSQTTNEMLHEFEVALKECGFEPNYKVSRRHNVPRVDGTARKDINNIAIQGKQEFLRLMGSIRPRRLLAKMNGNYGRITGDKLALVSKEFVGEQPVVMLDTTSRTYFANGLASHNCAIAGSIEEIRLANALRGVTVNFTDKEAVTNYSAIAGYKPGDPDTDQGTDVHELFDYRKSTGIIDADGNRHKVVAYAGLRMGDFDELLVALSLFDMVGIGIQVPANAEAQFEAGQAWHIAPGWHRIVGGHYIPIVGAASKDVAQLFTWGKLAAMERTFYEKMNTVAVVALTEELFNNGKSPEGIDMAKLAADLPAFNTGPVMAKRGKRKSSRHHDAA